MDLPTTAICAKNTIKKSVWYPYLDSVLLNISQKFEGQPKIALILSGMLQSSVIKVDTFRQVYTTYRCFMHGCEEELLQEIKKFFRHKENINLDHNLLKMLEAVPDRFPNVEKLLQIAVTIPVTSCSAECSFSVMKILKPRMRSMMSDGRLNGLALMYNCTLIKKLILMYKQLSI